MNEQACRITSGDEVHSHPLMMRLRETWFHSGTFMTDPLECSVLYGFLSHLQPHKRKNQ